MIERKYFQVDLRPLVRELEEEINKHKHTKPGFKLTQSLIYATLQYCVDGYCYSKGWNCVEKKQSFYLKLVRKHLDYETRSDLEDLIGDGILNSIKVLRKDKPWFTHPCDFFLTANGNLILGIDVRDLEDEVNGD